MLCASWVWNARWMGSCQFVLDMPEPLSRQEGRFMGWVRDGNAKVDRKEKVSVRAHL